MSDQPISFNQKQPPGSVFRRLLTPRTVLYLAAVCFALIFIRRTENQAQTQPATQPAETPMKLAPVTTAAEFAQPASTQPMLIVLDQGDPSIPALVKALRSHFADRCTITRVDVTRDPGALAHFSVNQAPAALLYNQDNQEIARKTDALTENALRQWLDSQLDDTHTGD